MSRREGGPHGLKTDPSTRADDQDYRHAPGRTRLAHRHVRCRQPHRKMGERLETRFQGRCGRTPRTWPSHPIRVCHGSSICPFSKPHPRHAATARVPSAHASSAHGRERNACGMRWRLSRARLSREKLLHLVESFLKSTHVIPRKNERNNTLLGRTDDKLDPGPSTYREMRDV